MIPQRETYNSKYHVSQLLESCQQLCLLVSLPPLAWPEGAAVFHNTFHQLLLLDLRLLLRFYGEVISSKVILDASHLLHRKRQS